MKRLIALVLVLCMALGTVVSVSAVPSAAFSRTLKLVRLIRTMFGQDEGTTGPAVGELDDGILTVYVSAKGKADATGTSNNPFATIAAARDAIRALDKSEFDGITVLVKAGVYSITEPLVLTAEDSGTKDCPITYLGEEGTTIVGGVTFTAADFAPATGKDAQYFPAEAKGNIVQIDLGQFGVTATQIAECMKSHYYFSSHPFLAVNSERQTLCQYPNGTWLAIDDGYWLDANGNETTHEDWDSSVSKEYRAAATFVNYGAEHFEHVSKWTSPYTKYFRGHLRFLWADTCGFITEMSTDSPTFVTDAVGYDPVPGGLLYFYNIPEELDIPGEYYIGDDAILYYYPGEGFDTALMSFPVAQDIIYLDSVEYITFQNLALTSCIDKAFELRSANHINILDCTISATGGSAIQGKGLYLNISGNYIHDIGDNAISIDSGDEYVASDYNNKTTIYNNYIRDWDRTTSVAYAIDVTGIGITVSHNTCHDSGSKGIHVAQGINVTLEYNHVFDILREVEDCGAISGDGLKENGNIIVRYNYIHDIGSPELMEISKTKNPTILVMGAPGIYYDNMASYYTTYGNVIANIDGDGYVSNGGRRNVFTGNLIINCSRDYVALNHFGFADSFDGNGNYYDLGPYPRHTFYYSDAFKAVNSEVAELIIDVSPENDPYDPMVFATPAYIVAKNNWVHYNTGYRAFSNWGISPYKVEDYVWRYAEDDAIDVLAGTHTSNSNMSTYAGKRKGYDIEELITKTAAGVIEITWEQFEEIGIVAEDWTHDIEIPEKVTVFEKNHENK